jgi:hypothetical protein
MISYATLVCHWMWWPVYTVRHQRGSRDRQPFFLEKNPRGGGSRRKESGDGPMTIPTTEVKTGPTRLLSCPLQSCRSQRKNPRCS